MLLERRGDDNKTLTLSEKIKTYHESQSINKEEIRRLQNSAS